MEAHDGSAPIWNKDVRFFKISQENKPKVCFKFCNAFVALLESGQGLKNIHFYVIFLKTGVE